LELYTMPINLHLWWYNLSIATMRAATNSRVLGIYTHLVPLKT
jgi:hypothetical protein